MKKIFLILILLLYSSLCNAQGKTGTLAITVTGVVPKHDCVSVGLFNSADDFSAGGSGHAYYAAKQRDNTSTVTFIVANLPYGEYAASAFQDIHCDGNIVKNGLGVPTVAYGFSNDVIGIFGTTPRFDNAYFDVNKPYTHVTFAIKS